VLTNELEWSIVEGQQQKIRQNKVSEPERFTLDQRFTIRTCYVNQYVKNNVMKSPPAPSRRRRMQDTGRGRSAAYPQSTSRKQESTDCARTSTVVVEFRLGQLVTNVDLE
jgi:hypothetical protein